MDVLRLNKSTYIPNKLVEGHNSLIWTERFQDPGEFKLTTSLIDYAKDALPINSLITLRDTREVMLVETHSIAPDTDGNPELLIEGRSAVSILWDRMISGLLEGYNGSPWKMKQDYRTYEVLALLIWNHVVDNNPVVNGWNNVEHTYTPANFGLIPNSGVSDSTIFSDIERAWWLNLGQVGDKVLEILKSSGLGLRMLRPTGSSGYLMSFNSAGAPSRTLTNPITKLLFDIYQGLNRTDDVVFDFDLGHLEQPKYLESQKDNTNALLIDAKIGFEFIRPGSETGWDYREKYMKSQVPEEGTTWFEFIVAAEQEGTMFFANLTPREVFDALISATAPYKFKEDYNLGDKVLFRGQYGAEQTVMITEYIRSEDASGESGYPTFQPVEIT